MGMHKEKRDLIFVWIKRKTSAPRPALQSNQSSLRGHHCTRNRGRRRAKWPGHQHKENS